MAPSIRTAELQFVLADFKTDDLIVAEGQEAIELSINVPKTVTALSPAAACLGLVGEIRARRRPLSGLLFFSRSSNCALC
jgi:hypothetical protein